MLHEETILYRWKETEFETKPRTKQWLLWFITVFVLLILIAVLLKNYLFIVILVVAGFSLWIAGNENKKVFVEVSKRGIRIEDEFYSYEKIHSFWITKNEIGKPILILKIDRAFHPVETVAIGEKIDLEELRNFLIEQIEEEEMEEPKANKLIHYLNI